MEGPDISIKVLGLSKSPAPTALLLTHEEEGSPPSWLAVDSVVRTAGSPMPDFINSSGDLSAPPLAITLPLADRLMVLITPPALTTTPVAMPLEWTIR